MSSYHVISTCENRYRLANDGHLYSGYVHVGNGAKDVKSFNRLGWAKKAAERMTDKAPWVNLVVIKVELHEQLLPTGLVRTSDSVEYRGRMVAMVVKSNLEISLFG
jgi:hypothetical protein